MSNASRPRRRQAQSDQGQEAAGPQSTTVASLGIRARLVPVDPERERAVAGLIARYERVCRDWDRLVQQAIALLGSEVQPERSRQRHAARERAE